MSYIDPSVMSRETFTPFPPNEMPEEVATGMDVIKHPAIDSLGSELKEWLEITTRNWALRHSVDWRLVHVSLGRRFIDPVFIRFQGSQPGPRHEYFRLAVSYEGDEIAKYFRVSADDRVIDILDGEPCDRYVAAVLTGQNPKTTKVSIKRRGRKGSIICRLLNLVKYNQGV